VKVDFTPTLIVLLGSYSARKLVQVFGVPDNKMGEEVCAWIKLWQGEDMDAEEVKGFCKGQITHFKIPRYIDFVDDYPMTVTGKIQKFKMREDMLERIG